MSRSIEAINSIHAWFLKQKLSLGFAESCTGGLISSLLSSQPGVSSYFKGAIVCYSGEVKVELLNVSKNLLKVMGEVSGPVAVQMAKGAREALNCDWSLAVTGIAGPSGGSVDKPVGTVCFAISGPGFEWNEQKHIEGKDRVSIQNATAEHGLVMLEKFLYE